MNNTITVAIQKKGRLANGSIQFFSKYDITMDTNNPELLVPALESPLEFLKLRDDDIPRCIYEGLADFGIVGENVLLESGFPLVTLKKLQFGACELVIAVPADSNIQSIYDLESERIATSYPGIVSNYFSKKGICASVLRLNGSVEAAPRMGLSDAICDISQTGMTLKENNLVPIATVFNSEAVLITSQTVETLMFSEKFRWFSEKFNLNNAENPSTNQFITNPYAYSN